MIIVNQYSDDAILKTIISVQKEVFFPIVFLNSETNLVKKAIEQVTSDYVLISTSDNIARPDFVEQHIKNRVENFFLIGNSFSISNSVSGKISKEVIYESNCFKFKWLKGSGVNTLRSFIVSHSGLLSTFLDIIFSKNEISKENLSGWKSDFINVINFDELCFDDLIKLDLKKKNIRYRSVLLKLTN